MRRYCALFLAATLATALVAPIAAPAAEPQDEAPPGQVAPYYPTPMTVVAEMLQAGGLEPGELHYDLGSGDGRFVIVAARDFGAQSVGFELEDKLVETSRNLIAEQDLGERATIEQRDLFTADLTKPDVVTVYLLPRALALLRPLLEEQLRPGAVVVSHDFLIPNWKPDERIELDEENEIDGLPHRIYVYRR